MTALVNRCVGTGAEVTVAPSTNSAIRRWDGYVLHYDSAVDAGPYFTIRIRLMHANGDSALA